MAAVIHENVESRPFTLGVQARRELVYDITGTDDEEEVRTLVGLTAPAVYGGLTFETMQVDPVQVDSVGHEGIWKARVTYQRFDSDTELTFDTGGGTQKITQSLGTINSYTNGVLPPPNFEGAIGVTEDSVEGVDITVPVFNWSETHRLADADVSPTYRRNLFLLTGTWNAASFKGFDAGECMFLGASGTKRGDEKWSILYRFASSPNVSGATIGDITGIDKLGWDYLWVRYADFEDGSAMSLVKRPVAVYVERVAQSGDFSLLGIGT
jgi:hypothetical protein